MHLKKSVSLITILLTTFAILNILSISAYNDYTISISQSNVGAPPGSSFQILVQVGEIPGPPTVPPDVMLMISPPTPQLSNFIFTFNPPNGIPPFVSTLTVQVKPGTPAGVYQVPVCGSNPVHGFRTKTLTVIVSASDFSLGISPSTTTIEQGEKAQYNIGITYANPADMGTPINIQIPNLPPGSSYSLTSGGKLTIQTSSSTPIGTYTFTVIGTAFGKTHSATASLIVEEEPPPFDFSINVSPSLLEINIGDKKDCTVTVNLISGSTQVVSLSMSGSPSDVSSSISPTSGNPTYTATATFDASSTSSTGSHTITFTGTGGGVTKEATLTLTIKEEKDISITASPSTLTIKQNEKAVITVDVEESGGFADVVTLTDSGLPSGTSSSFSPASGTPTFSSTYIIQTSDSTPEGTHLVTIQGFGGGKQASVTVTVNVEKKPIQQTTTTEETSHQTAQPEAISNLERLFSDSNLIIIILLLIVIIILAVLVFRRRSAPSPTR